MGLGRDVSALCSVTSCGCIRVQGSDKGCCIEYPLIKLNEYPLIKLNLPLSTADQHILALTSSFPIHYDLSRFRWRLLLSQTRHGYLLTFQWANLSLTIDSTCPGLPPSLPEPCLSYRSYTETDMHLLALEFGCQCWSPFVSHQLHEGRTWAMTMPW